MDYRDNAVLYEAVEDIPGEKAMFRKAAELITAFAQRQEKLLGKGITLLDLCCGTAPMYRYLPELIKCPLEEITGVDINANYLWFARQKYWERVTGMGADWFGAELNFMEHDAVDYTHPTPVDIILASSAYHHIEDERKLRFLEKVRNQLKDEGIAVFCENLIGSYQNPAERAIAVTDFYAERIKEIASLGIIDKRLGLVCRVLQYELDREYEWKHSYQEFVDNLRKAGLVVVNENKVWPNEDLFKNPKVGDFVFEVRKNA